MKVILLKDVQGTGKKDQIIEVSDGYARNFLLPRQIAKEATAEAVNAVDNAKKAAKHREDAKRNEAEVKARQLKGKEVTVHARGGENGRLYGSVTNEQIAAALLKQHGIEIDKRKIEPEEPIRAAGQIGFIVRLSAGISTRMLLNVVAEK